MLTLAYYLHCLLTVAAAVCFSGLLMQDGMILSPLARAIRAWYWGRFNADPDQSMTLKPLLFCPTCVSGQWAFWAYLCHYHGPAYYWYEHVYFVALALLFSLLLQWTLRRLYS